MTFDARSDIRIMKGTLAELPANANLARVGDEYHVDEGAQAGDAFKVTADSTNQPGGLTWQQIAQAGGSARFLSGTLATRPAPATVPLGSEYHTTDLPAVFKRGIDAATGVPLWRDLEELVEATTFYLDTVLGSDANGGTSPALPLASLEGLAARVPLAAGGRIVVNFAAGTYVVTPGVTGTALVFGLGRSFNPDNSTIDFVGSLTTVAGPYTVVGASAGGGVFNYSGADAADALRGATIRFTSGARAGQSVTVATNSAGSIRLLRGVGSLANDDAFVVERPAVFFDASATRLAFRGFHITASITNFQAIDITFGAGTGSINHGFDQCQATFDRCAWRINGGLVRIDHGAFISSGSPIGVLASTTVANAGLYVTSTTTGGVCTQRHSVLNTAVVCDNILWHTRILAQGGLMTGLHARNSCFLFDGCNGTMQGVTSTFRGTAELVVGGTSYPSITGTNIVVGAGQTAVIMAIDNARVTLSQLDVTGNAVTAVSVSNTATAAATGIVSTAANTGYGVETLNGGHIILDSTTSVAGTLGVANGQGVSIGGHAAVYAAYADIDAETNKSHHDTRGNTISRPP